MTVQGLENDGNKCYLNSIKQLLYTSKHINFDLNVNIDVDNSPGCAAEALNLLIKENESILDNISLLYNTYMKCNKCNTIYKNKDENCYIEYYNDNNIFFDDWIKIHSNSCEFKCENCDNIIKKIYYILYKFNNDIIIIKNKNDNYLPDDFKLNGNMFKRIAQVEHRGFHYITKAYRGDNIYILNDEKYSKIDKLDNNNNIFILLYSTV